jgi:hypothetical protein
MRARRASSLTQEDIDAIRQIYAVRETAPENPPATPPANPAPTPPPAP